MCCNFVANMGLRQEKLGSQIKKELCEIFLIHKDWIGGQFATITGVILSGDLGHAKVYYSAFTAANKLAVQAALETYAREIRRELAKRLKNNLKKIPELSFFEDETMDTIEQVETLFDKIKRIKK